MTRRAEALGCRLAVTLLFLLEAPVGAQSPEALDEGDYAAGRALLDAAIRATGDSIALVPLGSLRTSFCARGVEIGQSARPDAPYDTIVRPVSACMIWRDGATSRPGPRSFGAGCRWPFERSSPTAPLQRWICAAA